jgi:soluble lytic murein transglycosylase-like protein
MDDLFRKAVPAHGQWLVDPILAAASKYGINPFVLGAIVAWETDYGFAPGYTPKGAPDGAGDGGHGRTPWQIDDRRPAGHQAWLASADLTDIDASTDYAVGSVIVPLIKRFGADNLDAVLAGYNAGAGAVARHLDDPGSVTTATPYGSYVDAVQHKLSELATAGGVTVPQTTQALA